jgi:hypothetical protein
MPTFCRHNRFIERCPICAKTLPGNEPAGAAPRRARAASGSRTPVGSRRGGAGLRVRREGRAEEDGYSNELVPGLRASADAARLAEEIDFAGGRLAALALDPPGLYGELQAAAADDLERASWGCLLIAYLAPTEDADPFASIRAALEVAPGPGALGAGLEALLDELELGPRSSHEPGRGLQGLEAYAQWVARAGGGEQAAALRGDASWTPERRFSRLYERLSLPGFTRAGRYELLVALGRLGLYELQAETLQLGGPRVGASEDPTTIAAKRVFGIGDPLLLDRRAAALAEAAAVPIEALDLALANWAGPERATAGFAALDPELGAPTQAPAALGV